MDEWVSGGPGEQEFMCFVSNKPSPIHLRSSTKNHLRSWQISKSSLFVEDLKVLFCVSLNRLLFLGVRPKTNKMLVQHIIEKHTSKFQVGD